MCTLTYIPLPQKNPSFILTDNRDEAVNRPADFPAVYEELESQLFYPKDLQAGGTWFGISQRKRAMALLNGAFQRHERKDGYRKSRGTVVKELLAAENLEKTIQNYNFEGIEAFYGVIFSWEEETEILEVIWDGNKLTLLKKDTSRAQIWSSAMTFSPEEHQRKKKVFEKFMEDNNSSEALPELIWDFHQSEEGGMILDFGILKTTSISSFIHTEDGDFFRYKDLIAKEEQEDMIFWKS